MARAPSRKISGDAIAMHIELGKIDVPYLIYYCGAIERLSLNTDVETYDSKVRLIGSV